MANGTLKVQNIETSSGSGTITLGQSGETIALGATTNNLLTPAFQLYMSADDTGNTDGATVIAELDTAAIDTDNGFDSSTYTYTTQKAGKYFVYAKTTVVCPTADARSHQTFVYKNGSTILSNELQTVNFEINDNAKCSVAQTSGIVDLAVGDTLKLYARMNTSAAVFTVTSGIQETTLGGFKII